MNYSIILPTLWLGPNPIDTEEFDDLKALGITAILSLQSPEDVEEPGRDRTMAASAGLTYCNVAVIDFDSDDLRNRLPTCVKALERLLQAGHTVYLHCTAGVSRSPTVAAAYLHWYLGMPLDRALDHVCELRNCCPDKDAILKSERPANAVGRQG